MLSVFYLITLDLNQKVIITFKCSYRKFGTNVPQQSSLKFDSGTMQQLKRLHFIAVVLLQFAAEKDRLGGRGCICFKKLQLPSDFKSRQRPVKSVLEVQLVYPQNQMILTCQNKAPLIRTKLSKVT